MTRPRWRELTTTVILLGMIILLVVINLVVHVSAVEVAYEDALERWKDDVETQTGYVGCLVVDDSVRVIRILTLRCRSGGLKYVHVALGGTLLGESDASAVDEAALLRWGLDHFGDDAKISFTYFANKTVLRIVTQRVEVLIDPLTYEELWKVTFYDE